MKRQLSLESTADSPALDGALSPASNADSTSLTHVALLIAGIAVGLTALHFAAVVVTPFLLALVLAFILWPLLQWLRGRGLGTLPALIILFAAMVVAVGAIALVIGYSVAGLASSLAMYTERLSARFAETDAWFAAHGVTGVQLGGGEPSADQTVAALVGLTAALIPALYQAFIIVLALLFFLVEGRALVDRLWSSLDANDPNPARLAAFGRDVGHYFALRAAVNAVTGVGVTLVLWLLGVDFPVLWGVLTFFLSFIPYVGMLLASIPSVLLAWAEYDLLHAVIVGLALTVVNAAAENLVQPALMHKGLHLSPTFVFVSVIFWGWLLPGGGSFLAIPISLGLLALLANFPGANWFIQTVTTRPPPQTDRRAL